MTCAVLLSPFVAPCVISAGDSQPQLSLRPAFQPVLKQELKVTGDYLSAKSVDTPPKLAKPSTSPVYPIEFYLHGVEGNAIIACIVNTEGKAVQVQALSATHAGFVEPAIKAVKQWKWSPALKDGSPVNCLISIPVHFKDITLSVKPPKKLPRGSRFLLVPDSEPALKGEFLFIKDVDVAPEPWGIRAAPVFPSDLIHNNINLGEAVIGFLVNEKGLTEQAQVLSATYAALGESAVQAVKRWRYRPALKNDVPVNCFIRVVFTFYGRPNGDAREVHYSQPF